MFLAGSKVRNAGIELANSDKLPFLPLAYAVMLCHEPQSLANHARRTPAQLPGQLLQSSLGFIVEPGLHTGLHKVIVLHNVVLYYSETDA